MAGQSEAPDDLIAELARLMAGEARPENAPNEPQQQRVRIPGDDTPTMPPVPRFDFAANPSSERAAQPVPPTTPRPAAPPASATPAPAPQPQVRVPSPPPAPPQSPAPTVDSFGLRPSVTAAPTPPSAPPAEVPVEPFAFDFDLRSTQRATVPVSPVPPAAPVAPPQRPQPPLEQFTPRREPVPQHVPQQPVVPQRPVEPAPVRPAPVQAQVVPEAQVSVEEQPEPLNLDHDSLADLIAAELANDQRQSDEPAQDYFEQEVEPETVAPQADDFFSQVAAQTRGSDKAQSYASPEFTAPVETARPQFDEPNFEVAPEPVAATTQPRRHEPGFGVDPLAEIERLVGPAVRMSVQAEPAPEPLDQPEHHPAPAPLRSLATPTLPPETQQPARGPRRRPAAADAGSVDDAILAAAAASGARVEWVDHASHAVTDNDRAYEEPRKRRSFGMRRAVLAPLLALLLLGAGGGALYFMLGSGGPTGPAPTIVADNAPIKEVPEPSTEAPAQSVIFNEMAGGNNGANEQIVPRDQADAETISEATQNSGIGNVINSIDQGTTNPDGLVNRRVRTVTVRPDGTIVSGDSGLSGTSMLPVDRPNVPELPGNTAAVSPTATGTTPPEPVAATPTTPAVPPVQPGSVVPVVNASGAALTGQTVVIPSQKPADFASTAQAAIAAAAAAPAPQQLAAPAATAPAATPASGGAYVQLSSQRTEAAARESAQAIATRYGVLFGGANLEIQQVNLGERGIYYRVLVPAASREAAVNVCTNVRAAGGDCLLL